MKNYRQHLNKLNELLAKLKQPANSNELASANCPITGQPFEDPVIAADDHTYERNSITHWLNCRIPCISPLTLLPMNKNLRPNWTVKKMMNDLREKEKEARQVVIAECFQWIEMLNNASIDYTLFFAQQLLRAILQIEPNHPIASKKLQDIFIVLVNKSTEILLTLCGGSFMALPTQAPNETQLLTLFLHYLTMLLQASSPLLTLSASERVVLQRLSQTFECWLSDVIELQSIQTPEQMLPFAQKWHQRIIQQKSFCILPGGFAQLNTWWSNEGHSPTSDAFYCGPTASAAILEIDAKKNFRWTHIDPFSPYHPKARTDKKEKRAVNLTIQDIKADHISLAWLTEYITLKTQIPVSTHSYRSEHFYEVLLPRLEGRCEFKKTADESFKTVRENAFCSAWSVVKDVFYHLLIQCLNPTQGRVLYKKILCSFEHYLLAQLSSLYESIPHEQAQEPLYRYLLLEMGNKLAANALKLEGIEKQPILDVLHKNEALLQQYQENAWKAQEQKRQLPTLFSSLPDFVAPIILKNNQFIDDTITQNISAESTLPHTLVVPFFGYGENNGVTLDAYDKLTQLQASFDHYLKNSSLKTRLQDAYVVTSTIENVMISLLEHGLENWYQKTDITLLPKAASILLRLAQLYYHAAHRISAEHQQQKAEYNPLYYSKMVVVFYAVYVMIDSLARKDPSINQVLQKYQLHTALNNDWSFEMIYKTLILPDKTWMNVLGIIKSYLDAQKTKAKKIFDYSVTSYYFFQFPLDADKSNMNIQCAMALLEVNTRKKFHHDFQHLTTEKMSEKWAALWCDDYLPLLFRCLRDSAHYANFSLQGFTQEQMQHALERPIAIKLRVSGCYAWGDDAIDGGDTLKIITSDHHPAHYLFSQEHTDFQALIYPKDARENAILASHKNRPESLSHAQYLCLSFIRTNIHIKFCRLYIALKNDQLTLDKDEQAVLIKQTLFELSEIKQTQPLLERRWQNARYAELFVALFIEMAQKAQKRLSHYRYIKNALDILLFIYSFCTHPLQQKIQAYLQALRLVLRQQNNVISHGLLIYTYKNPQHLTHDDIEQMLTSRLFIEKEARMEKNLPADLYTDLMHVLLEKQVQCHAAFQQPHFFNRLVPFTNLTGSWQRSQDGSGLYRNGDDAFDPWRGRVYKNNILQDGLSKAIRQHPDYQAALQGMPLLVNVDFPLVKQKKLIRYTAHDARYRITLCDSQASQLWIEEKVGEDYYTFVPPRYLNNILPQVLMENHIHWTIHHQVFIKNTEHETVFIFDLNNHQLIDKTHDNQHVIPFHQTLNHPALASFRDVLQAFEEPDYILLLADQTRVKTLYFPRFHLTFFFENNAWISQDYKDYRLATTQAVNTLCGISHYLVIESCIDHQRKLIMGYRRPQTTAAPFYQTDFQADLKQAPYAPLYFTYTLDETLETLHAETIAGKLYLAWIFYKTASLARDPLTHLNGYEMAAEILKTCWQNMAYDEQELDLLVRFLDLNYDELQTWKAQGKNNFTSFHPDSADFESKLEECFTLRKEQHRNGIAILIRVLYLLSESLETHFLQKKKYMIQRNHASDQERRHYLTAYGRKYFQYYLNVKHRVDEKCCLTREEEKAYLNAYRELEKETLEKNHQMAVNNPFDPLHVHASLLEFPQQSFNIPGKLSRDYQDLIRTGIEKETLKKVAFSESAQKFLTKYYASTTAYTPKKLPALNHYAQWVDFAVFYDLDHFIALYQMALKASLPPATMESLLLVIALRKKSWWEKDNMGQSRRSQQMYRWETAFHQQEDQRTELSSLYLLSLRMLYLATYYPTHFPAIPAFLFESAHELHYGETFYFDDAHVQWSKDEWISLLGWSQEARDTRNDLWVIFEQKYLNNKFINRSLSDLEKPDFLETFRQSLVNSLSHHTESAHHCLQEKAPQILKLMLLKVKNKLLLDFFLNVGKACDQLTHSFYHSVGRTVQPVANMDEPLMHYVQPNNVVSVPFPPLPPIHAEPAALIAANTYVTPTEKFPEGFLFPLTAEMHSKEQDNISTAFRDQWIESLKASYQTYLATPMRHYQFLTTLNLLEAAIREALKHHRTTINNLWKTIHNLSAPHDMSGRLTAYTGQALLQTKRDLLKCLHDPKPLQLHPNAHAIIEKLHHYAQAEIQRMHWERVLVLMHGHKTTSDLDEKALLEQEIARNLNYQKNYDDAKYPAWLLFELENQLTIREEQKALVEAMVHNVQAQKQDKKTPGILYQLNMGKGKTSVVSPLDILSLADGQWIVRVNSLAALRRFTMDGLSSKFGGLLLKRVYQLPFSRDVDISVPHLQKIIHMLITCQQDRHILVMTPEHRLSLNLKYQEKQIEYAQFIEADNTFHWDRYTHYHEVYLSDYRSSHSQSSSSSWYYTPDEMKALLVKTEFIDEQNKILKTPEEIIENAFLKEVRQAALESHLPYKSGLWGALHVLNTQMVSQREILKQQLDLLTAIEKMPFCDLLDESDEILRHGFELNYTLGESIPLDGDNLRWKVPQMIFSILFFESNLKALWQLKSNTLKEEFSANKLSSLLLSELNSRNIILQEDSLEEKQLNALYINAIPRLRCSEKFSEAHALKETLCLMLLQKIARRMQIPASIFTDKILSGYSYEDYILGKYDENRKNLPEDAFLQKLSTETHIPMLKTIVLTARAWFAHHLLDHVFSKRYRVNYGLDAEPGELPTNLIAIRFDASGHPLPTLEFSHPDIMIAFTTLSYYYQGLHPERVKQTLLLLKEQETRNEILSRWLSVHTPESEKFESFDSFDLDNEQDLKQATFYFGRNPLTINYYLDHVVFPEKAKYFTKKISGDAHTLTGQSVTIGFSGTDDRKDTLPAAVESKTQDTQQGTNGQMIHIMIRPANQTYHTTTAINTETFLKEVAEYAKKPNALCYALIDVGATVEGFDNQQAARFLFKQLTPRFKGVIFFDSLTDKPFVFTAQGIQLLATCHLDKKELFAYYDEIHTRGHDLKLPLRSQGIVTLCRNLNKDKLMQAMMRLRQLEQQQSVCFWGTPDTTVRIEEYTKASTITSCEVLRWITRNSMCAISDQFYPIALHQIKMVIKQRKLHYQKLFIEHSLPILDDRVKEPKNSLESFYGKSLITVRANWQLEMQCSARINQFCYQDFKALQKIVSLDKNEEYKNRKIVEHEIRKIIEERSEQLPLKITISHPNFETDSDNEEEIHLEQIEERSWLITHIPKMETAWTIESLFEENFVETAKTLDANPKQYPLLNNLCDYLPHGLKSKLTVSANNDNAYDYSAYSGEQDSKENTDWPENILATQNFCRTIVVDNANNRNKYSYPVDMLLIHRRNTFGKTYFILISAQEAYDIQALYNKQPQLFGADIHLSNVYDMSDALTSCSTVLENDVIQKEKLQMQVLLKLLNGHLYFFLEEEQTLEKWLDFINSNRFTDSLTTQIKSDVQKEENLIKRSSSQSVLTNSSTFFSQTHDNAVNSTQSSATITMESWQKTQQEQNQALMSVYMQITAEIQATKNKLAFHEHAINNQSGGLKVSPEERNQLKQLLMEQEEKQARLAEHRIILENFHYRQYFDAFNRAFVVLVTSAFAGGSKFITIAPGKRADYLNLVGNVISSLFSSAALLTVPLTSLFSMYDKSNRLKTLREVRSFSGSLSTGEILGQDVACYCIRAYASQTNQVLEVFTQEQAEKDCELLTHVIKQYATNNQNITSNEDIAYTLFLLLWKEKRWSAPHVLVPLSPSEKLSKVIEEQNNPLDTMLQFPTALKATTAISTLSEELAEIRAFMVTMKVKQQEQEIVIQQQKSTVQNFEERYQKQTQEVQELHVLLKQQKQELLQQQQEALTNEKRRLDQEKYQLEEKQLMLEKQLQEQKGENSAATLKLKQDIENQKIYILEQQNNLLAQQSSLDMQQNILSQQAESLEQQNQTLDKINKNDTQTQMTVNGLHHSLESIKAEISRIKKQLPQELANNNGSGLASALLPSTTKNSQSLPSDTLIILQQQLAALESHVDVLNQECQKMQEYIQIPATKSPSLTPLFFLQEKIRQAIQACNRSYILSSLYTTSPHQAELNDLKLMLQKKQEISILCLSLSHYIDDKKQTTFKTTSPLLLLAKALYLDADKVTDFSAIIKDLKEKQNSRFSMFTVEPLVLSDENLMNNSMLCKQLLDIICQALNQWYNNQLNLRQTNENRYIK